MIIVAFAILAGGTLLLFSHRTPEPAYKGKTLSSWLVGMDYGADPIAKLESKQALSAIGSNAIPCLFRIVSEHDSETELKVRWWLTRRNIANCYPSPTAQERARACAALSWLAQQEILQAHDVIHALQTYRLEARAAARMGLVLYNTRNLAGFERVQELIDTSDRHARLNAIRVLSDVAGLLPINSRFDKPLAKSLLNTIEQAQKSPDKEFISSAEHTIANWAQVRGPEFVELAFASEISEPNGPANESQPIRSETNNTSSTAGSRR